MDSNKLKISAEIISGIIKSLRSGIEDLNSIVSELEEKLNAFNAYIKSKGES